MCRHRQSSITGFSLIELIVIAAIVLLLAFVLVPSMANARNKARQIDCANNLKLVGLSFRLSNPDSQSGAYTMARSTNDSGTLEVANEVWLTFLTMSNELETPKVLCCPSDVRGAANSWPALANSNISYFIGLEADESTPELPLAGDRFLSIGRAPTNKVLVIGTSDATTWSGKGHLGGGNMALADGTVQQYTSAGVYQAITNALRISQQQNTNATLRLAMPE